MEDCHQSGFSFMKKNPPIRGKHFEICHGSFPSHHFTHPNLSWGKSSRNQRDLAHVAGYVPTKTSRGGGSEHNKITCSYQHLPKGAKYTLRDGELRPFSKHLAPFGRSRYYLDTSTLILDGDVHPPQVVNLFMFCFSKNHTKMPNSNQIFPEQKKRFFSWTLFRTFL